MSDGAFQLAFRLLNGGQFQPLIARDIAAVTVDFEPIYQLAEVLHWLTESVDGPAPFSSNQIMRMRPRLAQYDTTGRIDYAVGRLALLEGNAKSASQALLDSSTTDHDWIYHACWAALLNGERERIPELFERILPTGSWAIAGLVADACPELDTLVALDNAPPGWTGLAAARLELATRGTAPGEPSWTPAGAPQIHNLEALRTILALRFAARDTQGYLDALGLPLFNRLPLADQSLWLALHQVLIDPDRDHRADLEAAAVLGHDRARLVQAALDLAQNHPARARLARMPRGHHRDRLLSRAQSTLSAKTLTSLAGSLGTHPSADASGFSRAILDVASPVPAQTAQSVCELVAAVVSGGPVRDEPEFDETPAGAALRVLTAASVAEADPDRCLGLLIQAAPHLDLSDLVDLGRLGPALVVRAGGQARTLTETVRKAPPSPVIARCAVAVGDLELAYRHWPRDETGRAAFLKHFAGRLLRDGDRARAAEIFREAGEPEHADRLRKEVLAEELLTRLLGGETPQRQRPGRLRLLEELIDAGTTDWSTDYRVWHLLAVLHRETALKKLEGNGRAGALLARTTALWVLAPAEGLMADLEGPRLDVVRSLLKLHLDQAISAFTAGDLTETGHHVRALAAVEKGAAELLGILELPGSHLPDFPRARTIAGDLLTELSSHILDAAELALTDEDDRPAYLRENYPSALSMLEDFARLGAASTRLLRTGLRYCDQWCLQLYQFQNTGTIRKSEFNEPVAHGITFADLLIPRCNRGQGHLPENQALGRHYLWHGWTLGIPRAESQYREALAWHPGDVSVANLLAELELFTAREAAEGGDFDGALGIVENAQRGTQHDASLDELLTEIEGKIAAADNALYEAQARHGAPDALRECVEALLVRVALDGMIVDTGARPGISDREEISEAELSLYVFVACAALDSDLPENVDQAFHSAFDRMRVTRRPRSPSLELSLLLNAQAATWLRRGHAKVSAEYLLNKALVLNPTLESARQNLALMRRR